MKVFDWIAQCCWFHLGKYLIPWMKLYIFIINWSVVYRCFNNCTTEVEAVCQAVASVFWPSGPTHGWPPCSFSPSLVRVVPLVPNLVSSPLSAWQVNLSSTVSCLEQLYECLRIQPSGTKSMHPVISSEVSDTIGRVPRTIDRVLGNLAESLVVHLTNASYNFRRVTMLKIHRRENFLRCSMLSMIHIFPLWKEISHN
jgi:hypothetical protein